MKRAVAALGAFAVATATFAGGQLGAATGDSMVRASVTATGGDTDGDSSRAWISRDGRYAVFHTQATNIVAADDDKKWDVYWRDLEAGTTELVSVAPNGRNANRIATLPVVSTGGRYVAFASQANNLVPGDTDTTMDVFRRDMVAGITVRVSGRPDGSEAGGTSTRPSISADGRHVAYNSSSGRIVAGDRNRTQDIFVKDMETGITQRASVAHDGGETDGPSIRAGLSADGSKVVFVSDATNLSPQDTNPRRDVYVRDLAAGITTLVSVTPSGVVGNNTSTRPAISSDGRWVVFQSLASDLVPGDTNGTWDIFLYDLETGSMQRVSVAHDGSELTKASTRGVVNADGTYVAYAANDRKAVARDRNRKRDVIRRDLVAGRNDRVSEPIGGGDGSCPAPASSPSAGNAGAGDDGGPSPQARPGAPGISTRPTISDDGQVVLFVSGFCNLVPGDENGEDDIYVRIYSSP